jgi:SAM-dependent methyltransferase
MSLPVTQRPEWLPAVRDVTRFFTGREYAGEPLEDRIVFYVQLLEDQGLLAPGKRIVDLGAGIYWFDLLVQRMGPEVVLVDDFGGGGGVDLADRSPALKFVDRYRTEFGMEVIEQNFIDEPLPFPDGSVDAITCFHSLEHWHHTPKPLFAEIRRVLKPGGCLILATPNAANIRKRVHVIFGANIWSPLEEWYHDTPHFRGHVREPIVRDLHRLCEWNDLRVVATHGRNFIGRDSLVLRWIPKKIRHGIAIVAQSVLQFFPTLCSDIHVVARKE